jgi:hypothetical protein
MRTDDTPGVIVRKEDSGSNRESLYNVLLASMLLSLYGSGDPVVVLSNAGNSTDLF